jgi:hypothetical protein
MFNKCKLFLFFRDNKLSLCLFVFCSLLFMACSKPSDSNDENTPQNGRRGSDNSIAALEFGKPVSLKGVLQKSSSYPFAKFGPLSVVS